MGCSAALGGASLGWVARWPSATSFLAWFFRLFNVGFDLSTGIYTLDRRQSAARQPDRAAGLRRAALPDLLGFTHTPTGFIPAQDKGYLLVNVQLPDSASVERHQPRHAAESRRSP